VNEIRQLVKFVAATTLAVIVLSFAGRAQAQDRLAAFMQAKLTHSEKTLEGLAKGDFELIAKHSQAISLLCEDELWAVLQTPEYLERSKEFRRNVNAITEAARKKNLEGATLAYVNATLNCVSCHKYLRDTKAGK
jgi:cytochrome c556